jgi:hypothetical protein
MQRDTRDEAKLRLELQISLALALQGCFQAACATMSQSRRHQPVAYPVSSHDRTASRSANRPGFTDECGTLLQEC